MVGYRRVNRVGAGPYGPATGPGFIPFGDSKIPGIIIISGVIMVVTYGGLRVSGIPYGTGFSQPVNNP